MKERWDREKDARWRKRAAEIAAEVVIRRGVYGGSGGSGVLKSTLL